MECSDAAFAASTEGSPPIATSTATRCENYAIPHDVSGQTLRFVIDVAWSNNALAGAGRPFRLLEMICAGDPFGLNIVSLGWVGPIAQATLESDNV
jgi:hypothetical protein